MLARARPSFAFPALDEDTRATTFYTTGTTGLPKGVYYSHRQLVLHTMGVAHALAHAPHATFGAGDVYMPITPMFHVHAWGLPYVATMLGVKQVYPGRYVPDVAARPDRARGRDVLALRADDPADDARQPRAARRRPRGLEGHHRRLGAAAAARARGGRARRRHHRRLRHVGNLPDPHACASRARTCCDWDAERSLPYRCQAGRPIPFVQLRIVDADMNDVAHDGASQGEVVVRAPWLTQGYLRRAASAPRSCGAAAGCTPATSASSTPTAISRSSTASRTS